MKEFRFRPYQQKAFSRMLANKHFALFAGMSLGKTALTLSLIDFVMYDDAEITKVFVISHKDVVTTQWPEEVAKWCNFQHLRVSVCVGTPKQREEALKQDADIYTINPQNVEWLFKYYGKNFPANAMLVIDESTIYKNRESNRFKLLAKKREVFKRIIELTGTPTPKGLINLWSQIYILDGGVRLGKTFEEFAYKYFKVKAHGAYKEYIPKAGAKEAIMERIKDICLSMETRDYLDLPEVITDDIRIRFSDEDLKEYKRFTATYVLPLDKETLTVRTAASLTNKLQQYTAGAIYDNEEEKNVIPLNTYKLDALEGYMDKTDEPVIVAYNFRFDLDRLKERFPYAVEYSSEVKKDWDAGNIRMLLMSPHKTAHGLNLQYGGRRLVFYSLIWDLEKYLQLFGRIDRDGQTKPPILTRLIIRETVDVRIVRTLDTRGQDQRDIVDYVKLLIDEYK